MPKPSALAKARMSRHPLTLPTTRRASGHCDGSEAPPLATDRQLSEQSFQALVDDVQGCIRCPRMAHRTRVLNATHGSAVPAVLFVGEAPGRLGADRTGQPFDGDQSGRNFAELLETSGIERSETFVTNAVLCNPRNDHGNNDRPARTEVLNCSNHLHRLIEILNPPVVVTLGATALSATEILERHGLTLRRDVAEPHAWFRRILVPMYHPGARARIHRSAEQQRRDFRRLARVLKA